MRLDEITKDEFHQKLKDPRKAEVDRKLKEWDDILRNRFKWRVDWAEWELDSNVITVTAYRARTLPVSTATTEDIRQTLWTFFIQDKWEERNDITITIEDEDEDSITWDFTLDE